jgi:zinc/manganese transport system permease protein
MDLLSLLIWPFLAGLVLTGIHTAFGVHMVERRVIFAGLSLPQLAALGTTLAYLAGHDVQSVAAYVWSFGFTILGAAILALTRPHRERGIPQEAAIAIVYAASAATAIVAISKTPQDTERLRDMLVGNILNVTPSTVAITAVLYALVGLLHFIFRKRFLAITLGTRAGETAPIPRQKAWDFLFYAMFGVVVTLSVDIAGVLLVFSYLIFPAVAAMLFASSMRLRLAIGWTMGAVVTAAGVLLSIELDLPTSAAIVCAFAAASLLLAFARLVTRRSA